MNSDKLDFTLKIVTAIGTLCAAIFIPLVIHLNGEKNRANEEKNRESQIYAQIMSQREQSDSSLRAQMFNTLIGSYFSQGVRKDPDEQIMYLYLLTLNFQEFFDARPLFEELDTQLTGEKRKKLLDIAREVADRQINLLTKPDNEPIEMTLCVEATEECDNMDTFALKTKTRSFPFEVVLRNVGSSEVRIRVRSAEAGFNFKTIEFGVSYFDTPFMNNTKLINGSRFAFVLKNVDTNRKTATVRVVTFPEEYMSLRDRPYFDEMLSRLGERRKSE